MIMYKKKIIQCNKILMKISEGEKKNGSVITHVDQQSFVASFLIFAKKTPNDQVFCAF